jgi:hypothetical protein
MRARIIVAKVEVQESAVGLSLACESWGEVHMLQSPRGYINSRCRRSCDISP